jgi:hypothetical protein
VPLFRALPSLAHGEFRVGSRPYYGGFEERFDLCFKRTAVACGLVFEPCDQIGLKVFDQQIRPLLSKIGILEKVSIDPSAWLRVS